MGSFSNQIQGFADKTGEKMDRVLRRSSLDVLRRLVVRSPVDTGRFRGNWQTGLDLPTGEVEETDKFGNKTIESGASKVSNARIGDSVFIINNLPYALPLENGHSSQAPHGMVGVTVAEWPGIVADANEALT